MLQLAENEIRLLCLTAKEIFMSQPNLLELEAPIKICGEPFVRCSVLSSSKVATFPPIACSHEVLTEEHALSGPAPILLASALAAANCGLRCAACEPSIG